MRGLVRAIVRGSFRRFEFLDCRNRRRTLLCIVISDVAWGVRRVVAPIARLGGLTTRVWVPDRVTGASVGGTWGMGKVGASEE